jgi:UDP-N-acetylglucosamine transferase subunit ALG13
MIFVTVGTSDPFDRLLQAVDELGGDESLVVQCGASKVRPARATCVDFLPFEGVLEYVRLARTVVAHAGVGTIMAALAGGKRPVVVPRLRSFGEAVDDHQLALARRLARAGLVRLVEDPARLAEAVVADAEPIRPHLESGGGLAEELRRYLRLHAGSAGARS